MIGIVRHLGSEYLIPATNIIRHYHTATSAPVPVELVYKTLTTTNVFKLLVRELYNLRYGRLGNIGLPNFPFYLIKSSIA